MASTKLEKAKKRAQQRVKQRVVAGVLVLVGVVHAAAPHHFVIDWPSVALIFGGAFVVFVPLDRIGSLIKSFKFGGAEVVLRKVKDLDDSVKAAEIEEGERKIDVHASAVPQLESEGASNLAIDDRIQALLSTDKEMALMRVALEIQKLLTKLYVSAGGQVPRNGIVWRTTLDFLVEKDVIKPATANACLGFRNVRNELIHSSGAPLPDAVIASALDSGISLIKLLSSL